MAEWPTELTYVGDGKSMAERPTELDSKPRAEIAGRADVQEEPCEGVTT